MKHQAFRILSSLYVLLVGIAACSSVEPEIRTVVETVEVPVIVEVPITIEVPATIEVPVTVEFPVTVEVTRLIEISPQATNVLSSSEDTPSSPRSTEMLAIGQEGRDASQVYVLKEWAEVYAIPHDRGGEVTAPDGGKFIVLKISFLNDGNESVDIYCQGDIGFALFDSRGRKYDDTGRSDTIKLYDILGNTGCNEMIQPGFGSEDETIAFLLPADAIPDYVMLWDPNEPPRFSDSFGEKSAVKYQLEKD